MTSHALYVTLPPLFMTLHHCIYDITLTVVMTSHPLYMISHPLYMTSHPLYM